LLRERSATGIEVAKVAPYLTGKLWGDSSIVNSDLQTIHWLEMHFQYSQAGSNLCSLLASWLTLERPLEARGDVLEQKG